MKLDLPFYQNNSEGTQCAQVAAKIVLEYFLGKIFTLEELDQMSGRRGQDYTWTTQIVAALFDLGLDLKYYSSDQLEPYLEGESYIRRRFSEDNAGAFLQVTDMEPFLKSVKYVLVNNLWEPISLTLEDIVSHLNNGHVPISAVDLNKLYEREGPFDGHAIVLTGYDDDNIFYHESGPEFVEPHKKVSKSRFNLAASLGTNEGETVVIYGKRKTLIG